MKAVVYEAFLQPPTIQNVADPSPVAHGVVVKVKATGVCRSDWHGWVGHDADIELPHVPGHELAGIVEAVGKDVTRWKIGDKVSAGQWVAVHGCGGIGLSAIMIAKSIGANVIAIDISDEKLAMAKELGAVATLNANKTSNIIETVVEITKGGAHVSIDALGHTQTCFNSISNLRKRGKHIQVGLMVGDNSLPQIPMGIVMSNELEIIGSHGMQAHRYDDMLAMINSGALNPSLLVGKKITLEQSIDSLMNMDNFTDIGVTVVTKF